MKGTNEMYCDYAVTMSKDCELSMQGDATKCVLGCERVWVFI